MSVDIHHGDALDFLRGMKAASVDAIITDPPYCSGAVAEASRTKAKGQGRRSENLKRFGWFVGDNMGTAGLVFLLRSVAFEAHRVVRSSGHLLIFCDWRMLPNLTPAIESAGWRYQHLVVWDKGSFGMGVGFRSQHELIMSFSAGSPKYHHKGTSNVLRSGRVRHPDHPTEKPVDLLRLLVRVVSPPGGTVVDPFAGSGSMAEACRREGRSFIGIERDPELVAMAQKRSRRGELGLF